MNPSHYPLIHVPESVVGVSKQLPPPVPRYRCQPLPLRPTGQRVPLGMLLAEGTVGLAVWLATLALLQWVAVGLGTLTLGVLLLVMRSQIAQNREYQAQLARYREQVSEHLAQENSRRQTYLAQVRQREEILSNPERLSDYRRQQLSEALSSIQCFRNPAADWQQPERAYEFRFLNYLERYFPGRVFRGSLLMVPDLPPQCLLDFAYIDPLTGLHLDIQVDEPFYLHPETGSCEPRNFIGSSSSRDQVLLRKGWVVIHFAEEQVIRYPKSCCRAVAETIAQVTGSAFWRELFANVPELPQVPRWTAEESMQMAIDEFRARQARKKAAGIQARLLPEQTRSQTPPPSSS